MKKLRFIIFSILFGLLQCQTAIADVNQTIVNEVNSYRSHQGLAQLKMNALISQVAKQHSIEMAENKIPFGHDGFDDRMHILFREIPHSHGIAENVAYVYNNLDDVVNLWLHSKGHRENIEGNYTLTGVGFAYGENGKIYVTQIFIR